jgi:excisionase family DNA binding protein
VLTITDFAIKYGISPHVVRTWISRHGLTHTRIGGRIYLVEDDVQQWLASKRHVSAAPAVAAPAVKTTKAAHEELSRLARKIKKIY